MKKKRFGPKDPAMHAEDTFSYVEGWGLLIVHILGGGWGEIFFQFCCGVRSLDPSQKYIAALFKFSEHCFKNCIVFIF